MADEIVVDGGVVVFKPIPGVWQWSGFNGEITLDLPPRKMDVGGHSVSLADDIQKLKRQLRGKGYKGTGFNDVPGEVISANIQVIPATLSRASSLGGKSHVLKSTRGTFQIACRPSMRAGAPPIPDPLVMKLGTWSVRRSGQNKAFSK